MTQDEIKHDLLQVCKVKGWDGDFNIVGFHVLCDKLKQLGVDEEREACAKACEKVAVDYYTRIGGEHMPYMKATAEDCAMRIRLRGTSMTEEDEEFQRLEREAKIRALEDDDTQVYKKPWVGLTRDEQSFVYDSLHSATSRKDSFWVDFANAIEQRLKEKNA